MPNKDRQATDILPGIYWAREILRNVIVCVEVSLVEFNDDETEMSVWSLGSEIPGVLDEYDSWQLITPPDPEKKD